VTGFAGVGFAAGLFVIQPPDVATLVLDMALIIAIVCFGVSTVATYWALNAVSEFTLEQQAALKTNGPLTDPALIDDTIRTSVGHGARKYAGSAHVMIAGFVATLVVIAADAYRANPWLSLVVVGAVVAMLGLVAMGGLPLRR